MILASSITIEIARRKLKASLTKSYAQWLLITVLLGVAFLVSQLLAWQQLKRGDFTLRAIRSSFFYLLTGAHAVHLAGGLFGLSFLWLRSRRLPTKRQRCTDGRLRPMR